MNKFTGLVLFGALCATACTVETAPTRVIDREPSRPMVIQPAAPIVQPPVIIQHDNYSYNSAVVEFGPPRILVRPTWERDDHRWNNGNRNERWREDRRYQRYDRDGHFHE
jgi:hypothetical protein